MDNFLISPFEKKRFGFVAGKAFIKDCSQITQSINEAIANKVDFLIVRTYVSEIKVAQELENKGFFITDTLVYYKFDIIKKNIPVESSTVDIRQVKSDEYESVKNVAERSFKGYFGHYHADSRLRKQDCDDTYTDWAYRSCVERKEDSDVFIATKNKTIVGFATMRLNNAEEGEGVLFGVDPESQGKGIYRSLIIKGLEWCKQNGCSSMVVSTQINNVAVQKVWVRVGFEPLYAYYTFHKWFN